MKRILLLLFLLFLAALSGCAAWSEGSYVYVAPHNEQYASESEAEPQVQQAETYLDLRTILLGFVGSGKEEGFIGIGSYGDRLEQDLEQAVDYVVYSDPIGAYAVKNIAYERTQYNEEQVIQVRLDFRHTLEEIQQIRSVRGVAQAQEQVRDALNRFSNNLVLQVSSFENTNFLNYVSQYCTEHPEMIMEKPRVWVNVYPQTGKVRVMEFQFHYETTPERMASMREQVQTILNSAKGYASSDSSESVRFQRLYAFLKERFAYQQERYVTPFYDLLCQGRGDSEAFARVFETLCKDSGLECQVVSGTRQEERWFWNLVRVEDVYYYVDLCGDLELDFLNYRADADMQEYTWQRENYPNCGPEEPEEPTGTAIEPTQGTQPPDTEPTEPELPTESQPTEPETPSEEPVEP